MHKSFPDWYRIVVLKPSSDMLPKRWETVEAMAKWEARGQVLDLVQLTRGVCAIDAPIRASITEAARASDAAFPARDNEAELRVLAGAAIVEMLKAPASKADLVALGLVCSTLQGVVGDELLGEFSAYARQYLTNEAVRVRAEGDRKQVPETIDLNAVTTTYRQAMQGTGDHKATAEPTVALVHATAAVLRTVLDELGRHVYDELDALREESNMFWWVFGGRSRDLAKSFRELGHPATCLVAAKELADLTELFPGPRAAPALLERVLADADGGSPTSFKLSDAVTSTPRDWRKQWLKKYAPPGVREATPLLTAVDKSLETEDRTDWISSYRNASGALDADLSPVQLASQAYLENVLVRVAALVKA
jgi:hypothetical protein